MTTWRRRKEVVDWSFRLPATQSWKRAVVETLAMLPPFARATRVALTTTSAGEYAAIVDDVVTVPAMLDQHLDGVMVHVVLELACVDEDGNAFAIPRGATLVVDGENDDGRVYVDLWLRVDIYAWRTPAERDHAVLAARNSPLLARFLADVRNRLGGEIAAIERNGYDVDENGFVRPG